MIQRIIVALCSFTILSLAPQPARPFPLGFSAVGAIGAGYYDMAKLNRHIGLVAQDRNVELEGISGGVNFRLEGRVWFRNQVALTGGYEHFWGETDVQGTSATLSYRAPSDVYTVGGIVVVLRLENAFNLCVGGNACFARTVYGTNELIGRRLSEFKGDDQGYEAYAEIHSNFINPVEVGFQLGYRGLVVESLTDKYGNTAYFEPGTKMEIDYSGVFFYLTTAIRI